jgi:hypothetical protein
MKEILIYSGSILIFIWGAAHIFPVKSIVKGFNQDSKDNILIITMEWIAEGLTLAFLGVLVFLVTVLGDSAGNVQNIVYLSSAVMLLVLALLSLFTGARTSVLPMKLCPVIKTITALTFLYPVIF